MPADLLVAHQRREHTHERHRGGDLAPFARAFENRIECRERRHRRHLVRLPAALGQIAAEGLAPLVHVLHLRRLGRRDVERQLFQLVVRDRDVELVAHLANRGDVDLLQLVRRVLRLALLAEPVAFDRLGQDDRRLPLVLNRRGIRSVDLVRIVSAPIQAPDVLVAHARDHLERLRVLAEEMLAHEGAVVRLVVLVLAVDRFLHDAQQDAILVAREQRVPVAAPDQLDDVPAGAAELAFELLDDLAVAAHRAVEPLQVAVHHEDQVVESFARREPDRAQRFRLVHLAVAAEHPDLAVLRLRQAARLQILQVARHVDRRYRPEPHRHRRELPVVGHQPRVRIRRDPFAVHLASEVEQTLLGQASLHQRARIDARRRMALKVDQIAAMAIVRRIPEVLLAGAEERADRGEAREVTAELVVILVRAHHHDHRIPAADRADALLERDVARRVLLDVRRNRVDIRRVGRERNVSAGAACLVDHARARDLRARAPPRAHRAIPASRARPDRWRREIAERRT